MGKLICSKDFPMDMRDWKKENIAKVFAGADCVMALTEDGRVLQKVIDQALAARTEYWNNITEIAISQWLPAAAIGLVSDGTCMISKRPIRKFCQNRGQSFDRINDAVKSWKDIVAVAASDAFFALDRFGKVHYVTLDANQNDYWAVNGWENVVRISVGSQNALYGVTADGKVLCAGANCGSGSCGNVLSRILQEFSDVVDVCALGSECQRVLLAFRDGTVSDLHGAKLEGECLGEGKVFASNFCLAAMVTRERKLAFHIYWVPEEKNLRSLKNTRVASFAVGHVDYAQPFVIGIE